MNVPDTIEKLGKLRDGLIVIGAVVYTLGYIVWSLIAWREGLGPLPLLESQYFIAGLVPALIIATIALLIALGRRVLLGWWPKYIDSIGTRRLLLLTFVFVVVALAAFATLLNVAALSRRWGVPSALPIAVATLVLIIAALALPTDALLIRVMKLIAARLRDPYQAIFEEAHRLAAAVPLNRWQQNFYVHMLPIVLGYVAIYLYVDSFYRQVPQALGGARPRCVRVDVRANAVAASTAALLNIAAGSGEDASPAESTPLLLYFQSDNSLVVGVQTPKGVRVLEIPRDSVVAIKACD